METTINIDAHVLARMEYAAGERDCSVSGMVSQLLKRLMMDMGDYNGLGMLVRYQGRRKRTEWRVLHVRFSADEYEYFIDLRKLLKMSVSFLVAYAVEKYLNVGVQLDDADKNRFRNYALVREEIDSVICWRLFWGHPHSLPVILKNDAHRNMRI